MSVTECGSGSPQQQGNSICFSHFLSGLVTLAMSDTPRTKDPGRAGITITPVKPDEP
ncbi:MAG: hypothetical protein WC379_04515 [Methanoregula sp.]